MKQNLLNELLKKSDSVESYEIADDTDLIWIITTKIFSDGTPFEVLLDFDESQEVVSVVRTFIIPLNDNFFSKITTISLFMQNELNKWLQERFYPGSFALSFDFGKGTSFEGTLIYCCDMDKKSDLPMLSLTIGKAIKALIEIVDSIDKLIEKARETPELLDVEDAIFIDKLNTHENITDYELFEKTMIFALHPAFHKFLSNIDDEDSADGS
jgi:hypothetical protein